MREYDPNMVKQKIPFKNQSFTLLIYKLYADLQIKKVFKNLLKIPKILAFTQAE